MKTLMLALLSSPHSTLVTISGASMYTNIMPMRT